MSHLFGTNTENSDLDHKGIFIPSAKEIILGKYSTAKVSSTNTTKVKNTKDDTDTAMYSLGKFLKMVQQGQTVAYEFLFTPDEFILEKDERWDYIVSHRDQLLHKGVSAFIGYAQQQAAKYGLKGSRMASIKALLGYLEKKDKDLALFSYWDDITKVFNNVQHIDFIELPANKNMTSLMIPHLSVCSRKFDRQCKVGYVHNILTKIYKEYGHRAKLAEKNEGVDWKAISHAARVSIQGIELLKTGFITLPLKSEDRKLVTDIKKGKFAYKDIAPTIEDLLEKLKLEEKNSSLRAKVDQKLIDDLIYEIYVRKVNL